MRQSFLEINIAKLMEVIKLRHIQGLLQNPPSRGQQQQVVVDQGGSQRLRFTAQQGSTAADHSHTAVATDLQIRASQTAGLPKPLQEALGTILIAT